MPSKNSSANITIRVRFIDSSTRKISHELRCDSQDGICGPVLKIARGFRARLHVSETTEDTENTANSRNPATAKDYILVIEDRGLAGRHCALRLIERNQHLVRTRLLNQRGSRLVAVTNFHASP